MKMTSWLLGSSSGSLRVVLSSGIAFAWRRCCLEERFVFGNQSCNDYTQAPPHFLAASP